MHDWQQSSEEWLAKQYQTVLGTSLSGPVVRLRWLAEGSLTTESDKAIAQSLLIEDSEIGWLTYLLPYRQEWLEAQVNQALGLRSRLMRESNYTGIDAVGSEDDPDSSWRVRLIWLVNTDQWELWQESIIGIRRGSGAAEEISFDVVQVDNNGITRALNNHGLPSLMLHTRAVLQQTLEESEQWVSADRQVLDGLGGFSVCFSGAGERIIARELEEKAKEFKREEIPTGRDVVRKFEGFSVQNFRCIDNLEVRTGRPGSPTAEAIILFGPNGTGKSSFSEALSLAAFGSSTQFENYMADKDIPGRCEDKYIRSYIAPLKKPESKPTFTWGCNAKSEFSPNCDEESYTNTDGVILSQEDSIKFSDLSREELALKVLRDYSALADHLSAWLRIEEQAANEKKKIFTRKHGLSGSIKLSSTAYVRLADKLLSEQLQRPSIEFLDWLRFLGRLSSDDGEYALQLVDDWTIYQDTTAKRLSEGLAKMLGLGAASVEIVQIVQSELNKYDVLAKQSDVFKTYLESQVVTIQDKLEEHLAQIDLWGEWLASQAGVPERAEGGEEELNVKVENLAKDRAVLEKEGKALRGRLGLLDQAGQFLTDHWSEEHPDTCPVCDSDVGDRNGISAVVSILQEEANSSILELRVRHKEIQKSQDKLNQRLKLAGAVICPLAIEDQDQLRRWLTPFLAEDVTLEDWLIDSNRRQQLKADLSRMKILPQSPKPYSDTARAAERIAEAYLALTREADNVLETPQAIAKVKKDFEQVLEKILVTHLPNTLEKVWSELTLTLTAAPWLLPHRPKMKLDKRGKSLSVEVGDTGRHIRYIYNAAERHILGLSWFFTNYLVKRRFDEAWMLLDDPAQEMDQPSFRELVRLWETLLRLHQKSNRPFTMITTLHQEERALDAARATNGKLYVLGWKERQEDTSDQPSLKKMVLLAPGYHPLKPETMFS